jgi:four helix bundle protein
MKYKRFEDLPVWNDAIALAEDIYKLTSEKPVRRRRSFCDQLERAGLSVSNNIAEGFERGTTSELLAFLYIARGSAGEVRSMLLLLRKIEPESNLKSQISDLTARAEKISRQLYGWMESLKNSEIQGQRWLDDKERKNYQIEKDQKEFLEELKRSYSPPVRKPHS